MATKRSPAPPRLLLFMISAVLSAIFLVYGSVAGWLSVYMVYFYLFFAVYYYSVCKGDKVAICYTIAGSISAVVFLLAVKYLDDSYLGAAIGIITAYFMTFMADIIVKCDWKYLSFSDFNFSSHPLEQNLQFKYDQHVLVDNAPPASAAESETPKEESEVKPKSQRKKIEQTPLSRRDKKIEARRQRRK